MMKKKGQLGIGEAPQVVLIVGLTFLILATIALVAQKYGEAMPSDKSDTEINETLTTVTAEGERVANYYQCNFEDFTVNACINSTSGTVIATPNYTTDANGYIYAAQVGNVFNNTNWNCTYTFSFAGTACNITGDLQTEVSNNTSIAGIVLTISLIGIVLSVLIGVFVVARNRGM